MNRQRGERSGARTVMSPRVLWAAASSLVAALLVAVPTVVLPAMAAPGFALVPDTVNATVGVAFSQVETYTATFTPTSLEVIPTTRAGISFDTETLQVAGTPTRPGTFTFDLVGSDGIVTETATLTVLVVCPDRIDIDTATASACLPTFVELPVGDQGASPSDTYTVTPEHIGDPHIAYNTQADGCAACHRTHGDKSQAFTPNNPVSRAVECLACHDGTGASSNVHADYTETATAGQVNDPATRSYYTHDAVAINTGHLAASSDEEGGSVAANEFQGTTNRHSDCVDCHNPHATAVSPGSVQRPDGWSLSGATRNVSVAVASGGFASEFVGHASIANNLEYQLCLKCHSNFTVLPTNDGAHPSRDWLDKAAEVDTNTAVNRSFHPVARFGTNQTETMTASLAGTSAYKRWKFATTDTVRCSNCHAGRATIGGPGQSLAPHSSANRGILILPYRDRALVPASESTFGVFEEFRVALCFACHTDVPFQNQTSSGTAFRYHFQHVAVETGTATASTDMDIDTPGAGNGHALCAECHFRPHSTQNAVNGQQIDGTRLVNFAPNVEPVGGVIKWTPRNGSTPGTCTLKCHGAVHNATAY